jgi:hypothetical protein
MRKFNSKFAIDRRIESRNYVAKVAGRMAEVNRESMYPMRQLDCDFGYSIARLTARSGIQ